jgi:flagellar protein FlbD
MIKLTKLNGDEFYLNPHLIEKIEPKADTLITMDSQLQYIVRERIDEINEKIIKYRRSLNFGSQE